MYVADSTGYYVTGRCLQERELPKDACRSKYIRTKSGLENINIRYCSLSKHLLNIYYGDAGGNCEHKLFDEVGPCEHCPSDKPYMLHKYFVNGDYPDECLSVPPKDEEYYCVRNMPTSFSGEYTSFHHVCFGIDGIYIYI